MKILLAVCLLSLVSGGAFAGMLDGQARAHIIELAMSNFWGNAILPDGSKVMPANDEERDTLPIATADAHDVIAVGEVSGLSEWCGLPWRSRYLKLTRSARSAGLKDKQVAFIGVLHGVAQGFMLKQMSKINCSETQKKRVTALGRSLPKGAFTWQVTR